MGTVLPRIGAVGGHGNMGRGWLASPGTFMLLAKNPRIIIKKKPNKPPVLGIATLRFP